jgi:hypothetical protein
MIVGFQNRLFSSFGVDLGLMEMLYSRFGSLMWPVNRFGARGQVVNSRRGGGIVVLVV